MSNSKGKTALTTKASTQVLTRHVCESCKTRIPQNEINAVKVIVYGENGRVVSNRMELTHAAGPCGKAKALLAA